MKKAWRCLTHNPTFQYSDASSLLRHYRRQRSRHFPCNVADLQERDDSWKWRTFDLPSNDILLLVANAQCVFSQCLIRFSIRHVYRSSKITTPAPVPLPASSGDSMLPVEPMTMSSISIAIVCQNRLFPCSPPICISPSH